MSPHEWAAPARTWVNEWPPDTWTGAAASAFKELPSWPEPPAPLQGAQCRRVEARQQRRSGAGAAVQTRRCSADPLRQHKPGGSPGPAAAVCRVDCHAVRGAAGDGRQGEASHDWHRGGRRLLLGITQLARRAVSCSKPGAERAPWRPDRQSRRQHRRSAHGAGSKRGRTRRAPQQTASASVVSPQAKEPPTAMAVNERLPGTAAGTGELPPLVAPCASGGTQRDRQ